MEIRRLDLCLAWSQSARVVPWRGWDLVLAPRLALSPQATISITCGKSYADSFAGSRIYAGGEQEFEVLHGTFQLWRTSVAQITDFAALAREPGQPPASPDLFLKAAAEAAKLLRS